MIALYADTATEEGRAAVAALAKMPHVHIRTTGGRPFAIWGGLCCTGALTIRGLAETLRLCVALRKTLQRIAPARQSGPW
jgi:hypothetical protein